MQRNFGIGGAAARAAANREKGDASKAAYEEDVNDLLAWNSPENDPKRRAHEAMLAEYGER